MRLDIPGEAIPFGIRLNSAGKSLHGMTQQKEGLFAGERSLVWLLNKPCLQAKEGLFAKWGIPGIAKQPYGACRKRRTPLSCRIVLPYPLPRPTGRTGTKKRESLPDYPAFENELLNLEWRP